MKNKRIGALLMLPLLAGMLAGCGGGGGGGGGSSDSVKIKFWHTFGQTIQDGLKERINEYVNLVKNNDHVDVSIEPIYQGSYDDIAKKISDGYSVGNRPTIAVAYPDNVADYIKIGTDAGDDFVVNLAKYADNETYGFGKEKWLGDAYSKNDFVSEFYEEGTKYVKEGTYSLPFMKSTEIMFYNKDLLKKTLNGQHKGDADKQFDGYDESIGNSDEKLNKFMNELSWDKFMDLCKFIRTNMKKIGNVLETPCVYDSDGNLLISKIYQENIPYSSVTTEGKGSIDLDKPGNIEKTIDLLNELNDNYKAGAFETKGTLGTYGSDHFTGEKSVFSIGSSGGSGYNFPQADAFELGVTHVPASNNNPLYVSQGPTLAIFSDNGLAKELNDKTILYAWKFLKYITNGEVNAKICVRGSEGYAPVRNSAYESEYFQEFMEEGENYAKCYKVIVDDINVNADYLVSYAFKGSAALRDECASLLTAAIQAEKDKIPDLISEYIGNARKKL